MTESGIPLAVDGWCGFFAASGMPDEQRTRISAAIAHALGQQGVEDKLARMGMLPAASSPQELGAFQRREHKFWANALQSAEFRKRFAV